MAFFAKKVDYRASPVSYIAILAIAKKKGGIPISYIVYGHNVVDGTPFLMKAFFTLDEALQNTAFGFVREFPRTSQWLHHVASGGSYEIYSKGTWVRVPTPRISGRKRKKRPPQFGDLGTLYRVAKEEHTSLENAHSYVAIERRSLERNLEDGLRKEDEHTLPLLQLKEERLSEKVEVARMRMLNLRCEMEQARSRRTGIPISPNSYGTLSMKDG